jgi:CPA1 family monovalent cation:H+ antiporter
MSLYTIITIIVSLAALFAYINHRFIRLPSTIGIMILSLASSLTLVLIGRWIPHLFSSIIEMVRHLDFYDLLINMMLSFLLFAGAIHINAERLKKERVPVMALATIGTIISTCLVGGMIYLLFRAFDTPIDIIYCLLFGALISPTDPIAVLGILKTSKIPQSLEMKISGESLFNDGVGVVIFLTLLEIAKLGFDNVSGADIGMLFLKEAGGGLVYGAALGYVGFLLLRSVDNYQVEVLITLAVVMGGYSLANAMHISGPLAMVVAGIITGNKGRELGMSDITRDYLGKFWELVDEILNAVLFLLIGLEMLVVEMDSTIVIMGLIAIFIVLLSRWLSVAFPVLFLERVIPFERHAIAMLTWGGLRGGISVALALSLPADMFRDEFVSMTYIVVVFSIIVQGLSIGRLAKKIY